jgi:hypothetical protein
MIRNHESVIAQLLGTSGAGSQLRTGDDRTDIGQEAKRAHTHQYLRQMTQAGCVPGIAPRRRGRIRLGRSRHGGVPSFESGEGSIQ